MSTIFGRPTGLFFSYDAIFEQGLSTLQKLVYIYFCRRANGNGESMPSYDIIVRDCGCHRSSAIEAVNQLSSRGLVVKHRRKRHNDSDTSNMYVIFPPDSPFDRVKEVITDSGKAIPKESSSLEGSPQTIPRRKHILRDNATLNGRYRKRQRGETVRNIVLLLLNSPGAPTKEIAERFGLRPDSVRAALRKIAEDPSAWAAKLGFGQEVIEKILYCLPGGRANIFWSTNYIYEAKATSYGDRNAHLTCASADYHYMVKPTEWRKKAEDSELRNHFFEDCLRNKWETRDYI